MIEPCTTVLGWRDRTLVSLIVSLPSLPRSMADCEWGCRVL